jgi:hypothetical protein
MGALIVRNHCGADSIPLVIQPLLVVLVHVLVVLVFVLQNLLVVIKPPTDWSLD